MGNVLVINPAFYFLFYSCLYNSRDNITYFCAWKHDLIRLIRLKKEIENLRREIPLLFEFQNGNVTFIITMRKVEDLLLRERGGGKWDPPFHSIGRKKLTLVAG